MGAPGGLSITEGSPEPLGASLQADGVNFAVWSGAAEAVEVCLFDAADQEIARLALPGRMGPVFHGFVPGLGAGARYGLRAHGAYAPERGLRFDATKLLIDPYALRLDRVAALHGSLFALGEDSAAHVPKAIVVPPAATGPADGPPAGRSWDETVIYELHVKGFTARHPDIPPALRGTFAGLRHPAAIAHLRKLGVTAVELLPCAAWIDERHLPPLGLTNYWGYNPLALMAPDPRLAPGGWDEVRAATAALAAAGIETILDVVFNHTGESDEFGPTLSLRGLDNAGFYRLQPGRANLYVNDAGTGNVLALDRPAPLRLAMDALRAWARLGGVAGFRFDLATVLGRRADGFDAEAPLLAAIAQDPELRTLKMIAEPWDCGPGGYQLGRFPAAWGEWNDRFRDTLRGFWAGDAMSLGRLATRLAGSDDVFAGRRPSRSVNFVVAHDGFTLADLVSFSAKRNWANGEDNRDGSSHEAPWNNGVEGRSEDLAVLARREADQRALLASLVLARGTPMLAMGAELGHSQDGNNNAYAQDNATSWIDWAAADEALADFTARLTAARAAHPALRADRFLTGERGEAHPYPDVSWRRADGAPLTAHDWDDPHGETLVAVFAEADGQAVDRVLLAFHRGQAPVAAVLPAARDGFAWRLAIDSAEPPRSGEVDGALSLSPRSVTLVAEVAAPGRIASDAGDAALARLAAAAGVAADWHGFDGVRHAVTPQTQRALLRALGLPAATEAEALATLDAFAQRTDHRPLPAALTATAGEGFALPVRTAAAGPRPRTWVVLSGEDGLAVRLLVTPDADWTPAIGADGRHLRTLAVACPPLPAGRYVAVREDRPEAPCHLTVAPARCFLPPMLAEGRRVRGLAAQLYALRRAGDGGVGDFTTLGMLGEAAALQGFAVVGINPLHALFGADRERASPYYPSDRRFLDPLCLDVGVAEAAGGLIDYPQVWAARRAVLEAEFDRGGFDAGALDAFIARGGEDLARFAQFEARAETPDASAPPARVRFHQYLQWRCDEALGAAAARAKLPLGFCRDLAVAAAPDGAEAWACAPLLAAGVSIGAPPDAFAPQGQVWGAPPYDPHRMAEEGFATYGRLLAANMRHAGALRIDHALGLARQFWVPAGAEGAEGAYVAFPLHDLLGQVALESVRADCLVIGEDLGVVPDGLRAAMAERNILGYRVLPFERAGEGFLAPAAYPAKSWACVATHDLPPLEGWWAGVEIDEREALGLTGPQAAAEERAARARDRADLIAALAAEGLAPPDVDPDGPMTDALAQAIHAFVARSASLIAVAQAEDLAAERVGVNLPGTDRQRPNWRRRLATPVEALFQSPRARAILRGMAER